MAHYCWVCERMRPNEAFSGKGHKNHICKECQRLPKVEIEKMAFEQEICRFLDQSRISPNNRKRLQFLMDYPEPGIKVLAELVLRVSKIAEGRRRRWSRVREADQDLFQRCLDAGLMDRPD